MHTSYPGGRFPSPPGNIYVNGYGFVSEDPSFRENRAIRKSAAVTGLILACILVLPIVSVYPIHMILDVFFAPLRYLPSSQEAVAAIQEIYNELARLLADLVSIGFPLLLATLLLRPQTRRSLFRAPSPKVFQFAPWICAGVWILAAALSQGVESGLRFFHLLELHPISFPPASPAAAVIYGVRVLLLPAFLEELLFRGMLLRSLRQFGDSFAIVTSAAAFGLIHYSLTGNIQGFILGLVLGYFTIRSGSVWTAVFSRLACLLLEGALAAAALLFNGQAVGLAQDALLFVVLLLAVFCFIWMCWGENSPFFLRDSPTGTRMGLRLRRFFGSGFFIIAALLWLVQAGLNFRIIG